MKKLLTISLAILLTMAFCFGYASQTKAGSGMDERLETAKLEIKNKISQIKTDVPIASQGAIHICADETWSGIHHITSDVFIDSGSTLTIMPGTQVIFDGLFSLVVAGKLVANGTASQLITFTHNTPPSNYRGISCIPDSNLELTYCNIDYAGADLGGSTYSPGLAIEGSGSVQNCTFSHSALINIFILNNSDVSISYSDFLNDTLLGIGVIEDAVPTLSGNNMQSSMAAILLDQNSASRISSNNFGPSTIASIYCEDDTKPNINDNYFIGGGLGGLAVMASGSTQLEITGNEVIDYFGGISLDENVSATIKNNNIKDNIYSGIYIRENTTATINYNSIYNNNTDNDPSGGGISLADNAGATVNYNDISTNKQYGINNQTTGPTTINAVKNYWGAASGPTHPSNPGGTGDAVTDNVTFNPWLDASYTTPPSVGSVNLTDGQTVSGVYTIVADSSWVVHGSPQEDITKVDFYIDGELKGSDTTYPYTYDWDTTGYHSPHAVRIVVTNILGNTDEKSYNVNVISELPYTGKM